jgi:glycine/D-amino acid oxidase-like deaminating enzyme
MQSLLIVGAGVFGLSTALAASGEYQVTLIDDGFENSASRGIGRIYRSQYPRKEYEKLALEAEKLWKGGAFSKNFHKTLRIIVQADGSEERDDGAAWIDANKTMREALEKAKEDGVTIIKDRVSCLIWDGSRCTGATTRDGRSVLADTILLALGAALPSFLAQERRHIDDICEPIVVPWMCAQLNNEQYDQLRTKPIVVRPGAGKSRELPLGVRR